MGLPDTTPQMSNGTGTSQTSGSWANTHLLPLKPATLAPVWRR